MTFNENQIYSKTPLTFLNIVSVIDNWEITAQILISVSMYHPMPSCLKLMLIVEFQISTVLIYLADSLLQILEYSIQYSTFSKTLTSII